AGVGGTVGPAIEDVLVQAIAGEREGRGLGAELGRQVPQRIRHCRAGAPLVDVVVGLDHPHEVTESDLLLARDVLVPEYVGHAALEDPLCARLRRVLVLFHPRRPGDLRAFAHLFTVHVHRGVPEARVPLTVYSAVASHDGSSPAAMFTMVSSSVASDAGGLRPAAAAPRWKRRPAPRGPRLGCAAAPSPRGALPSALAR